VNAGELSAQDPFEGAGEAEVEAGASEDVAEIEVGAENEDEVVAGPTGRPTRIWRTVGILLGLLAVVLLGVMAAAGYTPALYLLIIVVVGTVMIAAGARMH
jgi:hypothetical protein